MFIYLLFIYYYLLGNLTVQSHTTNERYMWGNTIVGMLFSIKGFILEPYNFSISGIWSAFWLVKTILNPLEAYLREWVVVEFLGKSSQPKIYSDWVPLIA
jgi:hypothetical protein